MTDAIQYTPDLTIGELIDFCAMGDDRERPYKVIWTGTACVGFDDVPGYSSDVVHSERRPVALILMNESESTELPIYLHPEHGWSDARYTFEASDWEPSKGCEELTDERVKKIVGY